MSINWVMTNNEEPVELPGEKFEKNFGDRISMDLTALNQSSEQKAAHISCPNGSLYLSKTRLVYKANVQVTYSVPGKGDRELETFAVDLIKVQNSQLVTPWFGANGWQAIIPPLPQGRLEPNNVLWKVKFTFREGGAFDFVTRFNAAHSDAVHGEALPAYEDVQPSA